MRDGLNGQSLLARSFATEIPAVFSRAGPKRIVDRNGVSVQIAAQVAPATVIGGELAALLEGASTNLCLESENFGTTWTAVLTPTRTAAAHTASGVTLDLIGDDDAAAAEGYFQAISFTADAVKAISIHVKQGSATTSFIQVYDTVAATNRLQAVLTWNGSVPSVAIGGGLGTYHGYEALADGVYRLLFSTTAVTAANPNRFYVWPAAGSGPSTAPTGTLYAGGTQAENAAVPSSYIPTTTGTVTRAADAVYFSASGAMSGRTLYARFIERGTILTTFNNILAFYNVTSAPNLRIERGSAGTYRAAHNNGSVDVNSAAGATPVFGDIVEVRGILGSDGSVRCGVAVNGGAESVGSASAANALSATAVSRCYLGNISGAQSAPFAYTHAVVAAGEKTMAEMRELAGV